MKTIFYLCILVFAMNDFDIGKIAKINKLKDEAESAYSNKVFNVAINRYKQLEELGVREEPMLLNLAHSYFNTKDTINAISYYTKLLLSNDVYIKSVANQQIGVIKANNKNYKDALKFFKEALRASPDNKEARYNYELVKKLLEQQQKQQQQSQDKNKDQQKQEQQEKEKQKQEQQQKQEQKQNEQGDKKENADKKEQEGKDDKKEDKKEGQKDDQSDKKGKEKKKENNEKRSQRLQQMNLTEEQAKTILDAMKSNEVQYLQQNKKKPTKKPEKGKPDW
jgi:Ca-activated chloride channel homolog